MRTFGRHGATNGKISCTRWEDMVRSLGRFYGKWNLRSYCFREDGNREMLEDSGEEFVFNHGAIQLLIHRGVRVGNFWY